MIVSQESRDKSQEPAGSHPRDAQRLPGLWRRGPATAEGCAVCGAPLAVNDPDDDCPLPVADQNWNIWCYAAYWAVYYLASPVTYIGSAHANLLEELGNSKTVCNLPSAWYMWCTIVPVVTAWLLPQPRLLKPLAILSVAVMAAATLSVALVLWLSKSTALITNVVILHGVFFGAANGIAFTSLWDFLRRGVSTSREESARESRSARPRACVHRRIVSGQFVQGSDVERLDVRPQVPDELRDALCRRRPAHVLGRMVCRPSSCRLFPPWRTNRPGINSRRASSSFAPTAMSCWPS